MEVILAVIGAALTSAGTAMWSPAAGVVTAGAQCLAAAYVVAYAKARAAR